MCKKTAVFWSIYLFFCLFFCSCAQETPDLFDHAAQSHSASMSVYFVDVGQGDCTIVRSPGGKTMLVDAGDQANGRRVEKLMHVLGIEKLDVAVATHLHDEHIGGLIGVLERFPTESVYMPRAVHATQLYQTLMETIQAKGLSVHTARSSVTIPFDDKVQVQVLAPVGEGSAEPGDESAVIKISYQKTSFLLTGDAEAPNESQLLSSGADVSADVLKIGRHGSANATTEEFLKAVSPSVAVISVGSGNPYGYPDREVLDRLAPYATVYRTDESGTLQAVSDGESIVFRQTAYSFAGSSALSAQSDPQAHSGAGITVFVTETGKKYHREACPSLLKSKISIALDDAKAQGYTACARCKPAV